MVHNASLMNGKKEIRGLKKPLEAAVGLTSRANSRYLSSKVTSKCDVSCFVSRAYIRSVTSDTNSAFKIFSERN